MALFFILPLVASISVQHTDITVADLYDFNKPDARIKLDNELIEISGLAYAEGSFLAVQDEKGRLYEVNPITGNIMNDNKFWGKGDFEDLAVVGGFAYVLKSNGNLYKTSWRDPSEDETVKIDLGFDSDWNFEGLAFQESTNSLLMAAKRKNSAPVKEIFAVDLDNPSAIQEPVYEIVQDEVKQILRENKKNWTERLAHDITAMNYSFNPSALAVHPRNGRIFVLSSPKSQLMILGENWKIRHVILLDPQVFNQPESICFDVDANLYIANEGGQGKATILKFEPQ